MLSKWSKNEICTSEKPNVAPTEFADDWLNISVRWPLLSSQRPGHPSPHSALCRAFCGTSKENALIIIGNIIISNSQRSCSVSAVSKVHLKEHFLWYSARAQTANPATSSSRPMPIPAYTVSKRRETTVNELQRHFYWINSGESA